MRAVTHAGLPLAGLIVLALAAGCDTATESVNGPEPRGTRVLLTDAPFPFDEVDRVDLYIVSVDASTVADSTDASREWTNIATPRRRFNLLELQRGATALMGEGALRAGQYLAVRVVIDTDSSSVVYRGGGQATVQWPVAGELALHALVEEPLAVPDEGSDIVIDVDVGRSFWLNEIRTDTLSGPGTGPDFVFVPWLRAVNEAATGGIVGRLLGVVHDGGTPEPIENATVSVLRGEVTASPETWWTIATGATDASGEFKIAFLLPGSYILRATPPGAVPLSAVTVSDVPVTVGMNTSVPMELSTAAAATLEIVGPSQVEVDREIMLRAVVLDANGDTLVGQQMTWHHSPPSGADLYDRNGGTPTGEFAFVRGLQPGVVSVAASTAGLSASLSVTVVEPDAQPVHTVELSPSAATIAVYDSLTIAVAAKDEFGNVLHSRAVDWTVSDAALVQFAFVSPDSAVVIGLGQGTATVTATSEGKSGTASVSVND